MTDIIKIGSKFTPFVVKKMVGKLVNIPIAHNTIYKYYLDKYGEVRILFNDGEKKDGYLTVGYGVKCDIKLEQNKNVRLFFPEESVSEIEIDRFLESIQSDDVYENFFSECSRLLKKEGRLGVAFLDSKTFTSGLSGKNLEPKYWISKKRYLYSSLVSRLNSIYRESGQIKRFLDQETVERLLRRAGFRLDKSGRSQDSHLASIFASKNALRSKILNIAGFLPKETSVKDDFPVYLFNCDSIDILNNFEDIDTKVLENRKFASVIGSLFFLNLLPILKPSEVLLFDVNPYQVRYVKMLTEVFKISGFFNEFLEHLFLRQYKDDPKQFLSQKLDTGIYKKVKGAVGDKEIFDRTLGKIGHAKYQEINGVLPALKIEGNSMCQAITVLDQELFKPGPAVNVVYTNTAFKRNFNMVKDLVVGAQIKQTGIQDNEVVNYVKDGGVVYVSNIGEDDWLYGNDTDASFSELDARARKEKLSESFRKQWKSSLTGFRGFLDNLNGHFWLIDSAGNFLNTQQLKLERSDSHKWLWQTVKPLLIGKTLEIIHKEAGEWGFKEYLPTVNVDKYILSKGGNQAETYVFHILLGNGVARNKFLAALEKSAKIAKRIVIIEHDRDSRNFGEFSPPWIVDIRDLINLIMSFRELNNGKISVVWSGASRRTDKEMFGNSPNYRRNMVVTVDL